MSDFEVIPDEERDKLPPQGKHTKPWHLALLEGKTVFVPLNGRADHQIRNGASGYLARRGFRAESRVTERDGVAGLVLWAVKREPVR